MTIRFFDEIDMDVSPTKSVTTGSCKSVAELVAAMVDGGKAKPINPHR